MITRLFEKNFGKQLQKLLDRTSMSQRELARRINVSNASVSRWVRGEQTALTTTYLFNICEIFSVDPMFFCDSEG